jgi:hypothetical protein
LPEIAEVGFWKTREFHVHGLPSHFGVMQLPILEGSGEASFSSPAVNDPGATFKNGIPGSKIVNWIGRYLPGSSRTLTA